VEVKEDMTETEFCNRIRRWIGDNYRGQIDTNNIVSVFNFITYHLGAYDGFVKAIQMESKPSFGYDVDSPLPIDFKGSDEKPF
jgi:hypothetical protein